MMNRDKCSYEFGKYRLDLAERLLLRGTTPVAVTAKVFDILIVLVENSGHLLRKDELMQAIWPDTAVEEGNLTRYVSTLRKALGENGQNQYIETVPRRGYRFIADVKAVEEEENLEMRGQTRAQVTIERLQQTVDRNKVNTEREALAGAQTRARVVKRGRLQALIAGTMATVIVSGAVYWWTTTKARQRR